MWSRVVCPESAWLVEGLIGNDNVSTGVVTWSALRYGAAKLAKKVAADPLSKTVSAAAAAKTYLPNYRWIISYEVEEVFP